MDQVAVGGDAVGGEGGGKQIAGGAGEGEGGVIGGGGGSMTTPDAPSSSSSATASTFSALTLNVWFQNYHCELRMELVVSEVRRLQPDLLCLQEVNEKLLKLLDPPLRELGYSTQSVLHYSYGEMLWWRVCRVTNVQLSQEPFHDSQQGRSLHLVRCVVGGRPLATATVHLESEAKNSSVRFAQLGRSLQQLRETGVPFLLAGDTNLNEKDDEILAGFKRERFVGDSEEVVAPMDIAKRERDTSIMNGVNDAWLSSGSPAPLFGMWDTVHNLSARYLVQARFDAACRFDRMLFSSHNLRCVQLELACTEVISTSVDGLPVQLHASDHWGLFAAFSFV